MSQAPAANDNHLIWVDMEMTGLQPDTDRVIEVALVVTDSELNILAESEAIAVRQPREVLDAMDAWNKSTHARSGLIDRVLASEVNEAAAELKLSSRSIDALALGTVDTFRFEEAALLVRCGERGRPRDGR